MMGVLCSPYGALSRGVCYFNIFVRGIYPGLKAEDIPGGDGWAIEKVNMCTHSGRGCQTQIMLSVVTS